MARNRLIEWVGISGRAWQSGAISQCITPCLLVGFSKTQPRDAIKTHSTFPNPDTGDLCFITNDSKLHMKKLHTIPTSFQAKDVLNNPFPANFVGEVSRGGKALAGRKQERECGGSQQQPSRRASWLHKPHHSINYLSFSLSVWIILASEWIQGVLSDLVSSSRSLNLKIIAGALLAV